MKSWSSGKYSCTGLLVLSVLVGVQVLMPTSHLMGQIFTVLHNFTGFGDGGQPDGGLIFSSNTLYGTASLGGGLNNGGVVFKVNAHGTEFTILHDFEGVTGPPYTNSGGSNPYAKLLFSGGTLYGTSGNGGGSGKGAVFKINADSSGFTNLYSFSSTANAAPYGNDDGANPTADLVLSDNVLYGTASAGGAAGNGTVFRVNTDGTGFGVLHDFNSTNVLIEASSFGSHPYTGLALSEEVLYGTASSGGSSGLGTLFKVKRDGTGFTNLHSFSGGLTFPYQTNTDGATPSAKLILADDTLYGTAHVGGKFGNGTVFKINTNGAGFLVLYHFTGTSGSFPQTNSDGANPVIGAKLNNKLYGTTRTGGIYGNGVVFAINTDGSGFTILHSFSGGDGSIPASELVLSGNTLYGTAVGGGVFGNGAIFSISLPLPQLAIKRLGTNVVLTWPINATGFALQSAPSIAGTFTNIAGATTPYTNTITGSQRYFRLISN